MALLFNLNEKNEHEAQCFQQLKYHPQCDSCEPNLQYETKDSGVVELSRDLCHCGNFMKTVKRQLAFISSVTDLKEKSNKVIFSMVLISRSEN